MREARYRTLPALRSSDFFCRVHLAVAVSTQSRMSLAMLRGRSVIGLLGVIVEDDRGLAAVGELDARRSQMQSTDHWLIGIRSDLVQRRLQPFTLRASEAAERVGDGSGP